MIKPLTDALQLHECLWSFLEKIDLPVHNRTRLASAAFRFVVDCQRGFSLLNHEGLHGPAFALVRPMMDGLQRGYWLCYCAPDATPDNLNDVIADLHQCDPSRISKGIDHHLFSTNIIEEIENCQSFDEGLLLSFKEFILAQRSKRIRDAMHSYTHIGYHMLGGYNSDEAIEASFDRDAICEILRLANHCACWAVIGTAAVAHKEVIAEEVFHIYSTLS